MMPDSADITKENGVIRWQNEHFRVSLDEAEAIADEIRRQLDRGRSSGVLVDNREASGTWPSEVSDVWTELMAKIYERGVDCATISPSATNAMQINRLARDAGTSDGIKAFDASDHGDALAFVGLD
jgi:hypothetical protein